MGRIQHRGRGASWSAPKKNKFHSKVTFVGSLKFHSKWEAERYQCLRLLEETGNISNLRLQVPFRLEVLGILICKLVVDFTYTENGKVVAEDAKGIETPVFRLKAKLFRAIYPNIELRVTKRK